MTALKRIGLALLLALTLGVVTIVQAQTAMRLWGITAAQLAAGATTGLPLLCTASGAGCALQVAISGALAAAQTVAVGSGAATAVVSGTLTTATTQLCTTIGTGEEDLWTYTLPANTLSTNGRGVRITTWGNTATNANTKSLRIYFGASLSAATHSFGFNNADWELSALVLRTGAAAEVFREFAFLDGNLPNGTTGTLTQDTTTAIVIKMTGQNGTASAGDICFRGAVVEAL